MFPAKKLAPDHRILKIRAYEDNLAKYEANTKIQQNLNNIASWEHSTGAKIVKRTINNRFEELKAEREAHLDERRERLAKKLYDEEKELQNELLNSQPTPEEARKKLADKARTLAARREEERRTLANELMVQHFRENCDPVREIDSRKFLYKTVDQRAQQLEEKKVISQMEDEEKAMYHQLWEMERLKKEERYQADRRHARESNAAMLRVLDEQMQRVGERKEEEGAARQAEIATLHHQWANEAAAAEAADEARRQKESRRIQDVAEFNDFKATLDKQRDQQEWDEDVKFVTLAMQKAAEDEARDRDAKERRRYETIEFRKQLAELAIKEAEDTSAQDEMIDAAARRQQAKFDAEQQAKEDARHRLMAEVLAERKMQVESRQRNTAMAKEEDYLIAERARLEAMQLADLEVEMRDADRRRKMQQRLDIQAQIWAKEQRQAAEQEQRHREAQNARTAEERYVSAVKQVEEMPTNRDFRRKKVEWFY